VSGKRAKRERLASVEPVARPSLLTIWLFRAVRFIPPRESGDAARHVDPGIASVLWFPLFLPAILLGGFAEWSATKAGLDSDQARTIGLAVFQIPWGISAVCLIRALASWTRNDCVRWTDELLGVLAAGGVALLWVG